MVQSSLSPCRRYSTGTPSASAPPAASDPPGPSAPPAPPARGAPPPAAPLSARLGQEVQHANPASGGAARRIGPAGPVGPACPVGSLHADPGGCLRHQHHHGGAHVEGLGEEVGAHADHRDLLTGDGDG